ncbi:RtcB family protein [Candidatus Dependentiae bacterium]|nr:RtcB family protein [Candidatus Dependentiae bacterium]
MAEKITQADLIKIEKYLYEIPRTFRSDMRVPARIFATEKMLKDIGIDRSLWQLVNVATLPGIVNYALAMPDIHEGYGFPIGGVAATAIDHGGVISPGGIGYDINCGVRLLASNVTAKEIAQDLERLATALFNAVPSGVGRGGNVVMKGKDLNNVLARGAPFMLEKGFGEPADIEYCEERGCMSGANPDLVSDKAKERGADQLGTLGSGNHFLEVQKVDEILDPETAQIFGLRKDQVTVMIHCGSRGLGHQTCTDYVRQFMPLLPKWNIQLPDKELVCAPFKSPEGQEYFAAMQASANFAWANRHLIGHWVRQAWQEVLGDNAHLNLVYDVSHNMGKKEKHEVDGSMLDLLVHRKGATRSFGAERSEVPVKYRAVGQPVLIPGTMGTASYVLVGTNKGMELSFGSSCHGAGRKMSRFAAKKSVRGSALRGQLESKGIIVRCDSDVGLAEEAPSAYKDVEEVVNVVHDAGIAKKVARLVPIAVIKGG